MSNRRQVTLTLVILGLAIAGTLVGVGLSHRSSDSEENRATVITLHVTGAPNGHPVPTAKVKFQGQVESPDKNGEVHYRTTDSGANVPVTATAPGYKPYSGWLFLSGGGGLDGDVYMTPLHK